MTNIDLSSLGLLDAEFASRTTALAERFQSEWDDDVHDSFSRYIKQVRDYQNEVHDIRTRTELILKAVEDLGVQDLCEKAMVLCQEVETI